MLCTASMIYPYRMASEEVNDEQQSMQTNNATPAKSCPKQCTCFACYLVESYRRGASSERKGPRNSASHSEQDRLHRLERTWMVRRERRSRSRSRALPRPLRRPWTTVETFDQERTKQIRVDIQALCRRRTWTSTPREEILDILRRLHEVRHEYTEEEWDGIRQRTRRIRTYIFHTALS